MKVLLVNDKGCFWGGVEQFLNDTATGLNGRGHEIHFLYTDPLPRDREPLRAPFASQTWLNLSASRENLERQIQRLIETHQPDTIYLQRFGELETIADLLRGQRVARYVHDHDLYCPRRHKYFPVSKKVCPHPLGVQCVLHGCLVSSSGPVPGFPGLINIFDRARELRFARCLPRVAAGSRWMSAALEQNGFRKEQLFILPPVPLGIERDWASASREPLILFVGQIVRGKGVDLLLHALAEVKRECHCVIVGAGPQMTECVALARKMGLGERVTFLGWVSHEKLGDYYARARVVAVPCRWAEPFGMVGVEAMWASRPVVAFATGGITDWLADGETGFAVPERDTQAFAQALDHILGDDTLCARMGQAAHERAEKLYRHETFLDGTEEFLRSAGKLEVEGLE